MAAAFGGRMPGMFADPHAQVKTLCNSFGQCLVTILSARFFNQQLECIRDVVTNAKFNSKQLSVNLLVRQTYKNNGAVRLKH